MEGTEHIIITDIDTLIKLRLDYISQETVLSADDRKKLIPRLKEYFTEHVPSGDFIAYGIKVNRAIASVAFLIISQRPPGLSFLNGKVGIIMNVLTYPGFRGKGYATSVMEDLINDASMQFVPVLDLYATPMGKRLYEKLGFEVVPYDAMMLKI